MGKTKKRSIKTRKNKKNKLWIMKGCSKKQRGGCATCFQKGGAGGITPASGPVGNAWNSNHPSANNSNHLSYNSYKTPGSAGIQMGISEREGQLPPTSFMKGGNRKRPSQKGGAIGSFFTQDFINLGRNMIFGAGSAYNGITGYPAQVNPVPYKGQLVNTPSVKAMGYTK